MRDQEYPLGSVGERAARLLRSETLDACRLVRYSAQRSRGTLT